MGMNIGEYFHHQSPKSLSVSQKHQIYKDFLHKRQRTSTPIGRMFLLTKKTVLYTLPLFLLMGAIFREDMQYLFQSPVNPSQTVLAQTI